VRLEEVRQSLSEVAFSTHKIGERVPDIKLQAARKSNMSGTMEERPKKVIR